MSMLNALIGALRVDLGMNSAAFQEGVTDAQRQMRRLEKEFSKIGSRMQSIGQGLSLAVTAPLAGIGAVSLRTAGNFEASMNRIRATLGASGAEMKALGDIAQELGRTTKFSATEAADAVEMLAKNGLGAADILGGALSASLSLAAASGAALSTASDIATDVMMQFGKEAGDLGAVVDGITGVLVNSKFGIDDYALALAQSGGVAGSVGVSFEDFNAAIAATSSLFASGSDAGTSLKTMLQRLVPASGPAAAAMERLGLEFFDAQGNMKDMRDIAQELQDGLSGLSEEAQNDALSTIFGTDAMRSAIGLAKGGAAAIDGVAAAGLPRRPAFPMTARLPAIRPAAPGPQAPTGSPVPSCQQPPRRDLPGPAQDKDIVHADRHPPPRREPPRFAARQDVPRPQRRRHRRLAQARAAQPHHEGADEARL
ncbi:phage tail tape measure protein [Mangrovicoccus ximenensis]|uniref:phage tail tape measure protein n=1 Tax=Mangrovicoccus ximenensis TaxID=1911570 RepID=UPI000D3A68D4|nr:phage tail tape measure protein [Mangrovicoccus ximenensis]